MSATLTFDIRVAEQAAIIDFTGDITRTVEQEIHEAYKQAKGTGKQTIIINFSSVEYINSTGIALIVSLIGQAMGDKIKLVTYGLTEHYSNLFTITRLADFMTISEDETAALNHATQETN